ncbi:MAG: sigma-54-dependent Fis family transcriptional regulator [Verrucomicrobiales bacterium]|nr:sigma-54-dependent Fis family transcriptional regulator [Verrucomicrobiales bacterium]
MTARILLIEDDPSVGAALVSLLQNQGWQVTWRHRAEDALALTVEESFALVLTDLRLPGKGGMEVLEHLRGSHPAWPVIVMTAHGSTDTAIEATKRGAYDYLVKPFDPDALVNLVEAALEQGPLRAEPVGVDEPSATGSSLVGRSRSMQALCKEIGRVAATSLPVLILGETGTGKELVARALVHHGARGARPFLAVNCAAVPEGLLESELFGHERGAFTGADRMRIGRFEQANGGTLFLDEIGDMPTSTQAKLLRVLQDGTFQRVGATESLQVDVRLLSATHRDLEREVVDGRGFREDLFFRLSGVILRVPPLRERPEDIAVLVDYFLRRHGPSLGMDQPAIRDEALRWLELQSWPGNVRQLEYVVRRALLHARPRPIGVDHVKRSLEPAASLERTHSELSAWIRQTLQASQRDGGGALREQVVEQVEAELYVQTIEKTGGNQAQAARWLGISRLTLRERLRELGWKSSTSA